MLSIPPRPSEHARAHPARTTERVVPLVEDRDPVHLADALAVRRDHDRAVLDELANPLLEQVRAELLLADGEVDVAGLHERMILLLGPEARLRDEIRDLDQARRELPLALSQARTVLDQPRDGGSVEMAQVVLAHPAADEGGVVALVLGGPVELGREVGLHLEELTKVLVELVEEVVEERRAEQDHLQVEGDRLRA